MIVADRFQGGPFSRYSRLWFFFLRPPACLAAFLFFSGCNFHIRLYLGIFFLML